jgi:hypothetical protein
MRKIYLTLVVNAIITTDESTLMNEIEESLFIGSDNRDLVDVEDSTIISLNVTDVK